MQIVSIRGSWIDILDDHGLGRKLAQIKTQIAQITQITYLCVICSRKRHLRHQCHLRLYLR